MSVTAVPGFSATGAAVGIKGDDRLDAALVVAQSSCAVGAVFTQNKAPAAPVQVSRSHLTTSRGRIRGVVLTSGNANAATGHDGLMAAEEICDRVARTIGCAPSELLIGQTGLIGVPFPIGSVRDGVESLVDSLGSSDDDGLRAATAIMTTDTFAKEVVIEGPGFLIGGMAKGAAMLAPNMATMLAVLTTDAALGTSELQEVVMDAVATSFNAMDVDGATSTNDTVIVMASGTAGPVDTDAFRDALTAACSSLAEAMVFDAEGATKAVRITVTGAVNDDEAHRGARKVANSLLVKCSLNGEDPYWGRILSEIATANIEINPDTLSISYGGTRVAARAESIDHDEEAVSSHLAQRWISIEIDLGLGAGVGSVLTTDLGYGYIDENRTTS